MVMSAVSRVAEVDSVECRDLTRAVNEPLRSFTVTGEGPY